LSYSHQPAAKLVFCAPSVKPAPMMARFWHRLQDETGIFACAAGVPPPAQILELYEEGFDRNIPSWSRSSPASCSAI